MPKLRSYVLVTSIMTGLMLSGCTSLVQNAKNENKAEQAKTNLYNEKLNDVDANNYVSFSNQPFLSVKTFSPKTEVKPLPAVFNQPIAIDTNEKQSLNDYALMLNQTTGLSVDISNEALSKIEPDSKGVPAEPSIFPVFLIFIALYPFLHKLFRRI